MFAQGLTPLPRACSALTDVLSEEARVSVAQRFCALVESVTTTVNACTEQFLSWDCTRPITDGLSCVSDAHLAICNYDL